jgi:hypothetical protein
MHFNTLAIIASAIVSVHGLTGQLFHSCVPILCAPLPSCSWGRNRCADMTEEEFEVYLKTGCGKRICPEW